MLLILALLHVLAGRPGSRVSSLPLLVASRMVARCSATTARKVQVLEKPDVFVVLR